jgi:Uma2 family endonuclease
VTCDERDRTARQYIRYPRLIVEVLSPSIEAINRGETFRHYRRIETLQKYVLIDPDRLGVECYRLNERGNWELVQSVSSEANPETTELHLASLECQLTLAQLYEDVELLP